MKMSSQYRRTRGSSNEEDGGAARMGTKRQKVDPDLLDEKKREIADLRQKLKESEEKNDRQTKTNDEEIAKLQKRIKTLEDEMKKMQKVQNDLKIKVEQLSPNKQGEALLHLGELCWQIQGSMYKKVVPKVYVSWKSYKVKAMENVIQDNLEEDERKKARNTWGKLKNDVKWDKKLEKAAEELQKERNNVAHPPLDEAALREYVKYLDEQEELKEPCTMQRLNELIDIWKHLKQEEY